MDETAVTADEAVAVEVRAEMARQRMTQQELADKLGHSKTYVYRRLNGLTPLSMVDLVSIAHALDVAVTKLVASAEQKDAS